MSRDFDDTLSPKDVFGNDASQSVFSGKNNAENGEDFIVVDGKRYVREKTPVDISQVPDPEVMREIKGPPRQISPLVFLWLLCTDTVPIIFGWFFACFGMIFVCVVTANINWQEFSPFARWEKSGTAVLISSESTNLSMNDAKIYKHTLEKIDATGQKHTGECFSSTDMSPRVGEEMEVECLKGTETYRIPGTSLGKMGSIRTSFLILIFVLIFPIVGMCFLLSQIRKGVRNWWLIKYGEVAKGLVTDVSPTGTRINEQPVMQVTYEYYVRGEKFLGTMASMNIDRLTDGKCEVLFVNTEKPKNIFVLDFFPKGIRVEEGTGVIKVHSFLTFLNIMFKSLIWLVFCGIFLLELAFCFGLWKFPSL
ncbi:MAG: hypothetical protein Q4C96_02630 [Planctomycetia bacterium]|nr:hypothetical protein [Planctomycetia bacterium]